jgi:hypothetical protein
MAPWLAHLFGVRPWETDLLDFDEWDALCAAAETWLERGGRWQAAT